MTVQVSARAAIIPQMSRRGKFITFEGLDGTGKSTHVRKLAAVLREAGHSVIETREPGGTMTGEKIRRVLLDSATALCDRFTDSTEAYQGYGRKLGSHDVLELHRVLCGNLQPDLTILLDSDAHASVSRARRRNKRVSRTASRSHSDENRFEQETRAFFARVHEGFLAIAKREQGRVVIVDASGTPAQTHAKIVEIVFGKMVLSSASRRVQHVR